MFSSFTLPQKVFYFKKLWLLLKKSRFSSFFLCSSLVACMRASHVDDQKRKGAVCLHTIRVCVWIGKKTKPNNECRYEHQLVFLHLFREFNDDHKLSIIQVLYRIWSSFFEHRLALASRTWWTSKENQKSTPSVEKPIFSRNSPNLFCQFVHNFF